MSVHRQPSHGSAISSLSVEKRAPRRVLPGERFEYSVTVTNMASGTLEGVVLIELLPSDLNIEGTSPRSEVDESHSGRWVFDSIAPQATKTVQLTCTSRRATSFRSHSAVSFSLRGEARS